MHAGCQQAVRVTLCRILAACSVPLPDHVANLLCGVHDIRQTLGALAVPGICTKRDANVAAALAGQACDVIPTLLRSCHQTVNGEASRLHYDHMGSFPESKVAFIEPNSGFYEPQLLLCGDMQRMPAGSMDLPGYALATLLASPGYDEPGDVEISVNVTISGSHSNMPFYPYSLGDGATLSASMLPMPPVSVDRCAYDRHSGCVFMHSASLCDHPPRGSEEWYRHIRTRHGITRRQGRAMLAAGYNATQWIMLSQAQKTQLTQLHG